MCGYICGIYGVIVVYVYVCCVVCEYDVCVVSVYVLHVYK